MIKEKKINIGNFKLVWDKVEALKWGSFGAGMFATTLIAGLLLIKGGASIRPSLVILACGAMGFMICAFYVHNTIEKNFK